MMGLIGQGCEHGDVLEVTGTNTPTQKTHLVLRVGDKKVIAGSKVAAKEKKNIVVFVFVVQCLTQHTPVGVVCFKGLCWWF